jgi:hypothetical protein
LLVCLFASVGDTVTKVCGENHRDGSAGGTLGC